MHRLMITLAGIGMVTMSMPVFAMGVGDAAEVESARANARAGGPTSERDAELLQRYGCLSGTDSAFCRRLEHRHWRQAQRKNIDRN